LNKVIDASLLLDAPFMSSLLIHKKLFHPSSQLESSIFQINLGAFLSNSHLFFLCIIRKVSLKTLQNAKVNFVVFNNVLTIFTMPLIPMIKKLKNTVIHAKPPRF